MSLVGRKLGRPGSFSPILAFFPAQTSLNIFPQVPGTASVSAAWDSISGRRAKLASPIMVRMRASRSYRLDLYNHRPGVAFYDRPH
jgi:hypothetical protein